MIKQVIMTVSPLEALNVLNGNASMLIRKRVPKGYVGWVWLVVSKGKPFIEVVEVDGEKIYYEEIRNISEWNINNKVVARYWHDEVVTLEYHKKNDVLMWDENYYYYTGDGVYNNVECILDKLQLEHQEVLDYGKGKDLYVITLNKLEILDTPLELGDFNHMYISRTIDSVKTGLMLPLTKAPSTYQYVYTKEK